MVNQSSISFVLSISSRIRKTLFSLMIMIRRQGNTSCLSLGFLNLRALYLQANCINGDHLSSCMSLKNMQGMRVISIYAGAEIFIWNFNKERLRLLNTKARITSSGFSEHILRIGKIRGYLVPLILAFSAFTCNRQYGKML